MNPPGTDYRPIACERHSEYELAIVQRRRGRLVWAENNVTYNQAVLPLDLETVNHEEFLICRLETGERRRIRLDRIHSWTPA
jgi:Rho-binding antiterminator